MLILSKFTKLLRKADLQKELSIICKKIYIIHYYLLWNSQHSGKLIRVFRRKQNQTKKYIPNSAILVASQVNIICTSCTSHSCKMYYLYYKWYYFLNKEIIKLCNRYSFAAFCGTRWKSPTFRKKVPGKKFCGPG